MRNLREKIRLESNANSEDGLRLELKNIGGSRIGLHV